MAIIRRGVPDDLPAASDVYRSASLSNAGDRDNLLAHPEYLMLGPEGLAEGRTYVAEEQGSLVGFATWVEAGGVFELEDLFVDPAWRRRGIAAALVNRIAQVLRARGVQRLEVTANSHAIGFYHAAGFVDYGAADTVFGAAPRMVRAVHRLPLPGHAARNAERCGSAVCHRPGRSDLGPMDRFGSGRYCIPSPCGGSQSLGSSLRRWA